VRCGSGRTCRSSKPAAERRGGRRTGSAPPRLPALPRDRAERDPGRSGLCRCHGRSPGGPLVWWWPELRGEGEAGEGRRGRCRSVAGRQRSEWALARARARVASSGSVRAGDSARSRAGDSGGGWRGSRDRRGYSRHNGAVGYRGLARHRGHSGDVGDRGLRANRSERGHPADPGDPGNCGYDGNACGSGRRRGDLNPERAPVAPAAPQSRRTDRRLRVARRDCRRRRSEPGRRLGQIPASDAGERLETCFSGHGACSGTICPRAQTSPGRAPRSPSRQTHEPP
jgi:hypothetical protein